MIHIKPSVQDVRGKYKHIFKEIEILAKFLEIFRNGCNENSLHDDLSLLKAFGEAIGYIRSHTCIWSRKRHDQQLYFVSHHSNNEPLKPF